MPRTTSARHLSLAYGLTALGVVASLSGCRQLVVFDNFPDGGGANDVGGGQTDGASVDGREDAGGLFCLGGGSRTINVTIPSVEVVVALDRSTGMNGRFYDSTQLGAGTAKELEQLVERYQAAIRFGLVLFPSPSPGCFGPPECCVGPTSPPTSPGLFAFDFALNYCNQPGTNCPVTSQRPIAQALDGAYTSNSDVRSHSVLLVTSGDPGCTAAVGGDVCRDAEFEVSKLTGFLIKTAVVGVGVAEGGRSCLDRLARAGGFGNSASVAGSPAELAKALDDFVAKIGHEDACELDVHSPLGPSDQVIVFQGGMPVPYGQGGWDFDGSNRSSIRLHGAACDRLLLDAAPTGASPAAARMRLNKSSDHALAA